MILVLEDDQLWLSAILVAGVSQFTTNIGGVLTARMLLYTWVPNVEAHLVWASCFLFSTTHDGVATYRLLRSLMATTKPCASHE